MKIDDRLRFISWCCDLRKPFRRLDATVLLLIGSEYLVYDTSLRLPAAYLPRSAISADTAIERATHSKPSINGTPRGALRIETLWRWVV